MIRLKTPRERGMAILLGGGLALMIAANLAERFVLGPLTARRAEIAAARKRIQDLDLEGAILLRSQGIVAAEAERSLAADPITAMLEYQHWLVDVTERCQLQDVHITPGQAIPEEHVGHRLPLSISCRGTFSALINLLERFEGLTTLHRVSHVAITPEEGGAATGPEMLGISIMIEALSLAQGPETGTLPSPGSVPVERRLTRLKQFASGLSLFSRAKPKPVRKERPEVKTELAEPTTTPAEAAPSGPTLIACGTRDRAAEAWFHVPPQDEALRVRLNEPFELLGQTVRVAEIGPNGIVLSLATGSRRFELGDRVDLSASP